jgi:hypothetical protein
MPCKDITELLEVTLDKDECLLAYTFSKRSCGQGIGATSLLIDQLASRSLNELLFKTADEFLEEFPIEDPTEEFLSLKHLFAIQGALEVYTGAEPGGVNDAFAASGIDYDVDQTIISGRIAIDIVTEKIKSCGGCGSCSTTRPKKKSRKTVGTSIPKSVKSTTPA